MKGVAVDVLLGVAVVAAWIGALGFARLSSSLDRLHAASFTTIGCGLPILLAAFVEEGASQRPFKILLLVAVAVVAGASVSQSIARAIFTRDEAGERM